MVEQLITEHLDLWTSAHSTRSTSGRGSSNRLELTGIKKLRELILELAVRGKLVPQDSADEPASYFYEKIQDEKARLVKFKLIKKPKSLPKIEAEDFPYECPNGWIFCRLGDVTNYGATDKAENTDVDNTTWVVELEDIEKGSSRLLNRIEFQQRPFKSSKNRFAKGDVLYGKLRPYLDKVLVATEPGVCTTEIIPVRPYLGIEPAFLRWALKSPRFIEYANSSTHGMNLPRMGTDKARLAVIPLPPIAEQKRIVAKVDQLMALCDQLEQQTEASISAHQTLVETLLATLTDSADADELAQNWARLAEHFDTLFTTEHSIEQLKQTILQLAVMGKLTSQNPSDTPADELLVNLTKLKIELIENKQLKKQKPLSAISEIEKPFELPSGWRWARIGDATLFSEYGISAKTFDMDDGIPVLKMGDIQNGEVVLGGQKKAALDYEGINELMLKNGDVLYNRTNSAELVGKTGRYVGPDDVYSFASYLIRIRCHENTVRSDFLNLNMNTPLFRTTQIDPHLKQQCGQANVNGTIMKSMVIAIAPLEEQGRIIMKVEELLAICDNLKGKLLAAKNGQRKLAAELVERAVA